MPSKKQGRKSTPKRDPETRIKEFAARFWQYSDAKVFDVNIQNWPSEFQLKLGHNSLGQVSLNWLRIVGLFTAASKPANLSDDEYVNAFQALKPEEKLERLFPSLSMSIYLLEYLPEKLNQAVRDLIQEALLHARARHFDKEGIKSNDKPGQTADKIGKDEAARIKQRLEVGRGGKRHKRGLADEVDIPRLVHFIDSVRPLWDYIVDFFAKHHYDEDCIEWIKNKPDYGRLLIGFKVSDRLLRQVYRKQGETKPELEPLGLAVEHAREQLGIKSAHATVSKHYKSAKRALKPRPPTDSTPNPAS